MESSLYRTIRASSSLSARKPLSHIPRNDLCIRQLHTTPVKEATPVPHPTVPGPPPSAPLASVEYPLDRISRKRQQAQALKESQNAKVNPNKPTSALSKRFWKQVSVKETDESLQVLLDSRPVRTAQKRILNLPKRKRALAALIAAEWDGLITARQALKDTYIPLTSLTSRSLDLLEADQVEGPTNKIREDIIKNLMRYLGTDTLLCWAPAQNRYSPGRRSLRERQREIAEPIIAFLTTHIWPGVEIVPILGEDSIVPISQPEITRQVIRGWLSGLPAYELAALERGTLAAKSLLVATRLLVEWSSEFAHLRDLESEEVRFDIEKAAEAASLEILYQTEEWGEVEDTHDVDKEDLRRQLGSLIVVVS